MATRHPAEREVAAREGDFPMRQTGERVHGPYPHHQRWRLFVDEAKGRRILSFESEARRKKEQLLKEIEGRTVNEAVREHVAAMRERGLRSSTVDRAEAHLRRFSRSTRSRTTRSSTSRTRVGSSKNSGRSSARRCTLA